MVLTQGFFNNLTQEFLQPAFSELTKVPFKNITNQQISLDNFTVDFNISNIKIAEATFNGDVPLIEIGQDQLTLEISDLDIKFVFDFEFISDPPILADIG